MARIERLEKLRDLVDERVKNAIQAGDLQGADEWSSFAVKLEERLRQISEREIESANAQKRLQKWWESIDEIVFLYFGLVLSIISEGIARILQPLGAILFSLFLSFLIVVVVVGYALWKRKTFM